jgi:hypothetical protein
MSRRNSVFLLDFARILVYLTAIYQELMTADAFIALFEAAMNTNTSDRI